VSSSSELTQLQGEGLPLTGRFQPEARPFQGQQSSSCCSIQFAPASPLKAAIHGAIRRAALVAGVNQRSSWVTLAGHHSKLFLAAPMQVGHGIFELGVDAGRSGRRSRAPRDQSGFARLRR